MGFVNRMFLDGAPRRTAIDLEGKYNLLANLCLIKAGAFPFGRQIESAHILLSR